MVSASQGSRNATHGQNQAGLLAPATVRSRSPGSCFEKPGSDVYQRGGGHALNSELPSEEIVTVA